MKTTFKPKYRSIINFENTLDGLCPLIKEETMIFSGGLQFAMANGGLITRRVLGALLEDNNFYQKFYYCEDKNLVIDTRVNMLMKGYYASIPGWHCDDVPRKDRQSQPDLETIGQDDETEHFIFLLSDDPTRKIAGTEFIRDQIELDVDPDNVWNSVDKALTNNPPNSFKIGNAQIISFNIDAIHRATPATYNGWRFFLRASFTYRKPVNEIRNQVQVYIPTGEYGW